MKRLTAFMLTVIFIFFSALTAVAVDTKEAAFTAEDVSCNKDRLFTVDVKAKSGEMLSAVIFKFTFDRKLMDFRAVNAPSDSVAVAYDNGNMVNVSYLCKDGKNISGETVIFTLKFKAVAVGQTDLSYTAYDCVNSSAESLPISECTSGKVTVREQSGDAFYENSKSEYSESSKKYENSRLESSQDELWEINDRFSDNTVFMLIVGILCGLAVGVLIFILYLFLKNRKNKAKKEKVSGQGNAD